MLLTDSADDGPTSKKSRKKKKRKRCEEEEEEEEFPAFKDICSDTEDNRGDHGGTDHQQQRPQTEQTGGQRSNKLRNNTIDRYYPPLTHVVSRNKAKDPHIICRIDALNLTIILDLIAPYTCSAVTEIRF